MHEHILAFCEPRTMQGTQLAFLASFLTNTSYRPLIHLRQSDRSLNEIQQKHFPLLPCDKHISHMRLFQSKYDYIKRHIEKFLQLQEPIDAQIQNGEKEKKKGMDTTLITMVFTGIAATQHIKTHVTAHGIIFKDAVTLAVCELCQLMAKTLLTYMKTLLKSTKSVSTQS